ncbi:hypothetical protein Tco_1198501, partial [Tanacetum coccineum]
YKPVEAFKTDLAGSPPEALDERCKELGTPPHEAKTKKGVVQLKVIVPDICSRSIAEGEKVYARAPMAYFKSASGASRSISDSVSEELMRKLQVGTSAYEAKKQKEMAIMKFKEMEFLMIDPDTLSEPKASIIRKKQEQIIAKYNQ